MKLQTVQVVRQGETTPYWFKVNPLYNSGVSGWIVFPDTEKQLAFSLVKRLLGKKGVWAV